MRDSNCCIKKINCGNTPQSHAQSPQDSVPKTIASKLEFHAKSNWKAKIVDNSGVDGEKLSEPRRKRQSDEKTISSYRMPF